jgi:hypothetical protein
LDPVAVAAAEVAAAEAEVEVVEVVAGAEVVVPGYTQRSLYIWFHLLKAYH